MELAIGTVLYRKPNPERLFESKKGGYWKVLEIRPSMFNKFQSTYYSIRCTKTGKEYKDTNGFYVDYVNAELTKPDGMWTIVGAGPVKVGTKANIDKGNKIGAKKRRIAYLEASINSDVKEYNQLIAEVYGKGTGSELKVVEA